MTGSHPVMEFHTSFASAHMDLDTRARENLKLKHFRAGHMIYLHQQAREKLYHEVNSFYSLAVKSP